MSAVFVSAARLFVATALAADFPWNDWRYTDYFFFDSDEAVAPFQSLSNLANRALTIATAEFIAARFHAFPDSREALDFFDCAWASIVQEGACDYAVLPRDEWSGPIRGALRAAMLVVNESMFEANEDGDYPARCVWILQLARHVIPKSHISVFENWFWSSKSRLDAGWSDTPHRGQLFDDHFDRGPLLGPCVFMEGEDVNLERAEACLREHVRNLVNGNRWLIDPTTQPGPHGHPH